MEEQQHRAAGVKNHSTRRGAARAPHSANPYLFRALLSRLVRLQSIVWRLTCILDGAPRCNIHNRRRVVRHRYLAVASGYLLISGYSGVARMEVPRKHC